MKRIVAQCSKELAQLRRDRFSVILILLMPLATLLIYGFAIRLEAKAIPLVVQNFELSSLSRTYTERLFATNRFKPIPWSGTHSSAIEEIDRGTAKATLILPPDFTRRIKAGKTSPVQVLVDGTDVNNARVIENSIRATTNFFLHSSGLQATSAKVAAQVRIWFNPGRKESLYIVPGVYGIILWIYPSLLAALAMVREKEQGTILQIYASSLSAVELLLGKSLAYFLVAIGETVFTMIPSSLIFGLQLAGDPIPLLIGTSTFLMSSVLFGLFIGIRSSTQIVAFQGTTTVGFLTTVFLTGFIYPLSNIPFPLSLISYFIPSLYYIDLTRDAFLRGTGWVGVWSDILVLACLGLLLFIAAWQGSRRMQLPK